MKKIFGLLFIMVLCLAGCGDDIYVDPIDSESIDYINFHHAVDRDENQLNVYL